MLHADLSYFTTTTLHKTRCVHAKLVFKIVIVLKLVPLKVGYDVLAIIQYRTFCGTIFTLQHCMGVIGWVTWFV